MTEREALESIVKRYESEESKTGQTPDRWGLAWAMYKDAKDAMDNPTGPPPVSEAEHDPE